MRTLTLLSSATTKAEAQSALKIARERNWSPESIKAHGSKAVKALLTTARVKQATAKPAGAKALKPVDGAKKYALGTAWFGALALPSGTVTARLTVVSYGARGGHKVTLQAPKASAVGVSFSAAKLDRMDAGETVGLHIPEFGYIEFIPAGRVQA